MLEGLREATARMVATLRIRQLQKDEKDAEEAKLRRLEDGAMAGGDGDRPDVPRCARDGSWCQRWSSERQ